MPLKVLINGGGVAGPALANFLLRSNRPYDITVVERSPQVPQRRNQLDLKAQGTPLMKKLGLIEAVRAKSIHETAVVLVDAKGKEWGSFSINDSEKGYRPVSSEFEIMRKI